MSVDELHTVENFRDYGDVKMGFCGVKPLHGRMSGVFVGIISDLEVLDRVKGRSELRLHQLLDGTCFVAGNHVSVLNLGELPSCG